MENWAVVRSGPEVALTLTVNSVSLISTVAGAEEAAEGVCAVPENVAGPVLAFVGVRHVATFAAVAVVAVALGVQTGTMLAVPARGVQAIVCKNRSC